MLQFRPSLRWHYPLLWASTLLERPREISRISVGGASKISFHTKKKQFKAGFPFFGAHSAAFANISPRQFVFFLSFTDVFASLED